MIVKDYYKIRADGVKLYRYRSDEGRQIEQSGTGYLYDEAIDPEGSTYTYTEAADGEDIPAEEALKIITGGDGDDEE